MKQNEQYYQKSRNDSFKPRQRSGAPQTGGAPSEDVEQRIVTLYTEGRSIEDITRAVGRARHLVVHLLQSRGIFGKRPTEPDGLEGGDEPSAASESKEGPCSGEPKAEPAAVEATSVEDVVEEPRKKVKRIRKPRVTGEAKPSPSAKAPPEPEPVEIPATANRWPPQVVEAIFKVVARQEINTGMSLQDVKRMVSKPRR